MPDLVTTLVEFLQQTITTRLAQNPSGRVQPVFVGPPADILARIFDLLTAQNTQEWSLPGLPTAVIVLFVDGEKGTRQRRGTTLSQRCNWDYVLANRNSVQAFLTLVAPKSWDDRQESITNATETIGSPHARNVQAFLESEPWLFIRDRLSQSLGIAPGIVSWGLTHVFKETRSLESTMRETLPWRIADELLTATHVNDFVRAIGLPSLGSSPLDVEHLQLSSDVLMKNFTRQLCSKGGLQEAERTLRSVGKDALRQEQGLRPLARPLRELFRHLYTSAGSGSHFEQCPMWYFRPGPNHPSWWDALPYDKLQRLLERIGATTPTLQGKLEIRCLTSLNGSSHLDGEPYLVAGPVELAVRGPQGDVPSSVSISRRPRPKKTRPGDDRVPETGLFRDSSIPVHTQALLYTAKSEQYQSTTVSILSLDSFKCGGYAKIRNALSNPVPQLPKGSDTKGTFEQKIILARGGTHELTIYRSSQSACVAIDQEGQTSTSVDNPAVFFVDLDEDQEIRVALLNAAGMTVNEWLLHCEIQESDERPTTTRFEALVRAHQTRRSRPGPVAPDRSSYIAEIERTYINSLTSWRGVIAGWTSTGRIFRNIEWDKATLGDLPIEDDTRVPIDQAKPPESYLSVRAALQERLRHFQSSLGEVPLSDKNLVTAIETYLCEYIQWLTTNPTSAAWSDCVALHAPLKKVEWEQEIATSEPVAVLLSPLHPLRLAWHCHAQQVLDEALTSKLCTAAGTLDPHTCPGILALPMYRGETLLNWTTFFAVGCNQPHWSFFWNKEFLGSRDEKKALIPILEWLGLALDGLTSGFTPSQARRSLEEVSSILSARATLRIGLVGDNQESTGCIEGLLDWCQSVFQETEEEGFQGLPRASEIYDLREQPVFPSAAELAILSEETDERVRWFSRNAAPTLRNMDLVILDQVGTREFRGVSAASRSPLAPGALFRVDIRQDIGDAPIIQESRVGYQEEDHPELAGFILKATTAIESLALGDHRLSHLQFIPNQRAIGSRLNESRFVAATSSQVDPACFIRGARGYGGYLWDYELPGTLGFDQQNAGYYLVAKPSESMKRALAGTMSEIVPSHLTGSLVDELLDEVSRRGVPVLKRLVGGGNHARGELGVLLGVRLLQDAFRFHGEAVRLPVIQQGYIHLLLSVDSYREPFRQFQRDLGKDTLGERPDVLVFAIRLPKEDQQTQIKITPLEIKFRDRTLSPNESREALQQAAALGTVLDALWVQAAPNQLWWICTRALLAQCLDQAFRVYADSRVHSIEGEQWTRYHQEVLHDITGGRARITVNKEGRAFIFDQSRATQIYDYDRDGRDDTAVFSRDDMAYLLTNIGALSPKGEAIVRLLDFSFFPSAATSETGKSAGSAISTPKQRSSRPSSEPPVQIHQRTLFSEEDLGAVPPEISKPKRKEDKQNITVQEGVGQTSSQASSIPSHLRQQVNEAFAGFIGNKSAVKRVTNDLLRALTEVPPHLSKNYLLTGQPSVGKTELARRIAKALDLPMVQLDGRGLASRERLFELVQGELHQRSLAASQVGQQAGLPVMHYPPLVIFVDEVHLVSRGVQESLLTMLERADRTVILANEVAKVEKVTFLFATTRTSDVDPAFYSRCAEVQLKEYTPTEVARIVEQRFSGWTPEIYKMIADLGRGVPRVAIELARELETEITVSEYPGRSLREHLEEVRQARDLDTLGLTLLDRKYLQVLNRENSAGENTILKHLGIGDKERVLSEIEPFLIKRGFIRFGRRGREITLEGKQYLQQIMSQDNEGY
jgi:DNA phosphorothioation-dependent restriction protein DptH